MARIRTRKDSNIFGMLTQTQISQLREAYNMLDANNDTFITKEDLLSVSRRIGNILSEQDIDEMIGDEKLMYMNLLTMIGDKLSEIDNEAVLIKAFREFDDGSGKIKESLLRHWLENEGDKISREDVDFLFRDCLKDGYVDYYKLACIMKHGELLDK